MIIKQTYYYNISIINRTQCLLMRSSNDDSDDVDPSAMTEEFRDQIREVFFPSIWERVGIFWHNIFRIWKVVTPIPGPTSIEARQWYENTDYGEYTFRDLHPDRLTRRHQSPLYREDSTPRDVPETGPKVLEFDTVSYYLDFDIEVNEALKGTPFENYNSDTLGFDGDFEEFPPDSAS